MATTRPLGDCPFCGEPIYRCTGCDELALADDLHNGLCKECEKAESRQQQSGYERGGIGG